MNLRVDGGSAERFTAYVDGLASVIGHADRIGPLRDYCIGLMLPVSARAWSRWRRGRRRCARRHSTSRCCILSASGSGRTSGRIVLDQRVGRVEDVAVRAVVLLELDQAHRRSAARNRARNAACCATFAPRNA